jgi:hypothetical protein
MAVVRAVHGNQFFPAVLVLPMCVNGSGHFYKPGAVLGDFQKVTSGKILCAVGRRIAKRLDKAGMDEGRNVVGLAVQHPASLFRRQADRQLAEQRQEPDLIVFHANTVRDGT